MQLCGLFVISLKITNFVCQKQMRHVRCALFPVLSLAAQSAAESFRFCFCRLGRPTSPWSSSLEQLTGVAHWSSPLEQLTGVAHWSKAHHSNVCQEIMALFSLFRLAQIFAVARSSEFLMSSSLFYLRHSNSMASSSNSPADIVRPVYLQEPLILIYQSSWQAIYAIDAGQKYVVLRLVDHFKAYPKPQPIPAMATPKTRVSSPDFQGLSPIILAFANPRLKSSTTPMTSTAASCWLSDPTIKQPMMQGSAGKAPKTMKEMRVTTPHFSATFQSTTTSPSSSSIMMLTKAWLLVAMRSEMRLQSSMVKPLSRQMSMISFFSSLRRCSTSQSSLASSDLMYWISARAERQSPRPIPMPSPTMAAMQKEVMLWGVSWVTMPVSTMMRVLMLPSSPPQTSDFRISPASMWFSSCSPVSTRCFFRFSLDPFIIV